MKATFFTIAVVSGSALAAPVVDTGAPIQSMLPFFAVSDLAYYLDPARKADPGFQSNLTFNVVTYNNKTGAPLPNVACAVNWSTKKKNKQFKGKFVACDDASYAVRVVGTPLKQTKITIRYREDRNATKGTYTDSFAKYTFNNKKNQKHITCQNSTEQPGDDSFKGRACLQKTAKNGTADVWQMKTIRKEEGKNNATAEAGAGDNGGDQTMAAKFLAFFN